MSAWICVLTAVAVLAVLLLFAAERAAISEVKRLERELAQVQEAHRLAAQAVRELVTEVRRLEHELAEERAGRPVSPQHTEALRRLVDFALHGGAL
ncbi:hypothetical protein L6R53_14065 [Myxococcota bacterium]|nr:hypothetical protein [Myxococcota bacterium]